MTRRHYANNAPQQTLAASITNSVLTCQVSGSFAGWPVAFPFHATLDYGNLSEEIILVTNIVGTTATIVRGQDGTAATSHNAGATIDLTVVALDFDEANAHVNSNSGVHGRSGNLVGDTDVQTLSNKTLTNPTVNSQTLTGTVANTSTHQGNPALKGQASTVGGKSLSLRDSTGVEKVSVLDSGNTSIQGTLTVGGVPIANVIPIIRVYTTGATWTKPAGLAFVRARAVGAGGGGGGCTGAASGRATAGGGGGGGYSEILIDAATLSATVPVTVGAGGPGSTTGAAAGTAGGGSSFGTHCVAAGGGGGDGGGTATTGNATANGGAGGTASGDNLNVTGQPGGVAAVISGATVMSGFGGSSAGIHGGGGVARSAVGAGAAGVGYGGGGSGSISSTANTTGGAGADGVVIVEEFYF